MWTFFWSTTGDSIEPNCQSDLLMDDGVDILSCLLTDSGGLPWARTIDWLDEGLARVESVGQDSVEHAEWMRECWGARLDARAAMIYSLYEESYEAVMPLSQFQECLSAWRLFLLAGPPVDQ